MRDWDHDGDQDYWDDVYYLENVDPYYNKSSDSFDLDDDDDDDDYYSSSSGSSRSHTPTRSTYSRTRSSYKKNIYAPSGLSILWKVIIFIIVITVLAIINELLAVIALIIFGYYELLMR